MITRDRGPAGRGTGNDVPLSADNDRTRRRPLRVAVLVLLSLLSSGCATDVGNMLRESVPDNVGVKFVRVGQQATPAAPPARPATSSPGPRVSATPLANLPSCMEQPNPITQLVDVTVGTGEPASRATAVLVRLTSWSYNPQAQDFKGAVNGLMTQVYDFPTMGTQRYEGTAQQYIIDGILPIRDLEPMKVGGKRTEVVPCHAKVIDIELFEVAATKEALRLKSADLPAPRGAVLAAHQQQQEDTARNTALQSQQRMALEQRRKAPPSVPSGAQGIPDGWRNEAGTLLKDVTVGTGRAATTQDVVITTYLARHYDATKPDFKGQVAGDCIGPCRPYPYVHVRELNTLFRGRLQYAEILGMKVGGKRTYITTSDGGNKYVADVELLEIVDGGRSQAAIAQAVAMHQQQQRAAVDASLQHTKQAQLEKVVGEAMQDPGACPPGVEGPSVAPGKRPDMTVFGVPLGAPLALQVCRDGMQGAVGCVSGPGYRTDQGARHLPVTPNSQVFGDTQLLKSQLASGISNWATETLAGSPFLNFLGGKSEKERQAAEKAAQERAETAFSVDLLCGRVQKVTILTNGLKVQDTVLKVLTEKWGRPTQLKKVVLQNEYGAQAYAYDAMWRFSQLIVTFIGSAGEGELLGGTFDHGGVIEAYTPVWEQHTGVIAKVRRKRPM